MKTRKNYFTGVLMSILMLAILAGCSATRSKAFTFSIDNGDMIRVSLDTSDSYDITSDLPFVISCGDETLSQGIFIHSDVYEQYAGLVDSDESAVLLDSGTKDGNAYIFWSYNDSEYNYAILIGGSDTGILLANNVSEESARQCFDRLTVSAEE